MAQSLRNCVLGEYRIINVNVFDLSSKSTKVQSYNAVTNHSFIARSDREGHLSAAALKVLIKYVTTSH